jgi:hypothetical protein
VRSVVTATPRRRATLPAVLDTVDVLTFPLILLLAAAGGLFDIPGMTARWSTSHGNATSTAALPNSEKVSAEA